MGRKSALSPEQWAEVERRHFVDKESVNSIAKSLGVNEGTIRKKILPNSSERKNGAKSLKTLAIEKVDAENAVKRISDEISELPISRQNIVNDLARQMVNVSKSLMSAAELNAKTSHRLAAIANAEVQKIDDSEPMSSSEVLKGVAVLTKMSNESAALGLNLIAANKGIKLDELEVDEPTGPDLSALSDSAIAELMTLRLAHGSQR